MKYDKSMIGKICLVIIFSIMIASCTTLSKYKKRQAGDPAINDINATLMNAYMTDQHLANRQKNVLTGDINEALLPSLSVNRPAKGKLTEKRFNVSVDNVSATNFFAGLVKGTKYNVMVSPKVQGTITLHLKNVTIGDVLQAVHDIYGFEVSKTSYGFKVFPPGLNTRVFTLNYLDVSRVGQSDTTISSGQISEKVSGTSTSGSTTTTTGATKSKDLSPTSSIVTKSNTDFWKQVDVAMKTMVGDKDGRKYVITPDAGLIIVTAYPKELKEVGGYLDSLQASMTRQVILEAKILEVALSAGYQAGIDWTVLGLNQNTDQSLGDNLATFTNIFTLDAHFGSAFANTIRLLSTQGNVQTLSSPRIATMNNQKAIIKVGEDQFFITNVTSSTLSGASVQATQDVELTPFFSGVALDVTPEIAKDGDVILHIHPLVSEVSEDDLSYTINGTLQTLPLAKSKIRESDNIVHAQNGQVVVIAGLMENNTKEYLGATPFLTKLPLVGPLFRRTNQSAEKSELVILLRPIVVGDNTWTNNLRKTAIRVRKLKRGFHFGAYPKVFGNLGEPKRKS